MCTDRRYKGVTGSARNLSCPALADNNALILKKTTNVFLNT